MAGLPVITFEGRLTADPDLRFIPSGAAVCNFTIVAQDRRKTDSGEWEETGDPLFVRVNVWRNLAENCAESLAKNDLVVVVGKLMNRKWQDKEGNDRYSLEISAYSVSASLQFRNIAHAKQRAAQERSGIRPADPWESPPPADDQPPF